MIDLIQSFSVDWWAGISFGLVIGFAVGLIIGNRY